MDPGASSGVGGLHRLGTRYYTCPQMCRVFIAEMSLRAHKLLFGFLYGVF